MVQDKNKMVSPRSIIKILADANVSTKDLSMMINPDVQNVLYGASENGMDLDEVHAMMQKANVDGIDQDELTDAYEEYIKRNKTISDIMATKICVAMDKIEIGMTELVTIMLESEAANEALCDGYPFKDCLDDMRADFSRYNTKIYKKLIKI